jgi:hypothetical protein
MPRMTHSKSHSRALQAGAVQQSKYPQADWLYEFDGLFAVNKPSTRYA